MNSVIGAATTAATTRLNSFEKAVVEYQKSLNNLRALAKSGRRGRGPAASLQKAKQRVWVAYQNLEKLYATELRLFAAESHRGKNRGSAFNSSERGIVLATRKPGSPKADVRLNVESQFQTSQLARMGKLVNGLGTIAVGADASIRAIKVMAIEDAGGDWMREAAKQVTGFGFGGAAGIGAGQGVFTGGSAIAASAGLTISGPVGWAVMGALFLGSVATGYFAGVIGDAIGKEAARLIMELQ